MDVRRRVRLRSLAGPTVLVVVGLMLAALMSMALFVQVYFAGSVGAAVSTDLGLTRMPSGPVAKEIAGADPRVAKFSARRNTARNTSARRRVMSVKL